MSETHRTVLVIMVTLLVAAFLNHHKKLLFFPFTVLMFLFGMFIGALTHAAPEMRTYLGIANIDPHLIFHIFLPVLIYDGACALKLSVFSKVLKQALVLAGPGLITNTMFVAIFMRYVLYSFEWPAAILFGAILSATDPVAVVAILKELDADTAVSTLTDGEAIMNDGTAIILFSIFIPAAQIGGSFAPWYEYIWRALLFTVGAYVFGKICGIIMLFCMTRCHNEPIIETLIQFGGAYVAFWVADVPMQSSGVLTLAVMGIHVSSNRNLMTKELSEMNENFWELAVFIANAVIFALVGLIIAETAIPKAEGSDYGMLIALYILIHLFRAIMIGMLSPVFRSGYYQLNMRRYIMLVYGALRGGVSLTLALVVSQDEEMPEEVRNKTLFLVGGIVILSIAVNGSSAKYVVQFLGLDLKPPYRNYQYRHGQKLVEAATDERIRELRGRATGRHVNWPLLRVLTRKALKEHVHDDAKSSKSCDSTDFFDPAIIRAMKHALQRQREEALISSSSFAELLHLIDEHIDAGTKVETMDVVRLLEEFPNVDGESGCLDWWDRTYQMLFGTYTAHAVMHVEILSSFLDILDSIRPTIMMLVSRRFSVKPHLAWLDQERQECTRVLDRYTQRYGSITSGLHTMRHCQKVLDTSMVAVEDLEIERGFPRSQAHGMRIEVSEIMHHVASFDLTTLPAPSHYDVFESCMMFEGTTEAVKQAVHDISTLIHIEEGERLHPEENCICVLVHGRIRKLDRTDDLIYGPGDFFGMHAALANFKAGNYFVLETGAYYRIDGVKFTSFLHHLEDEEISEFKKHLWALCGARVAQAVLARNYPYCTMQSSELLRICNTGKLMQCPLAISHAPVDGADDDGFSPSVQPTATAVFSTPKESSPRVPNLTHRNSTMPTMEEMEKVDDMPNTKPKVEGDEFGEKIESLSTSMQASPRRAQCSSHRSYTDDGSSWFLLSGQDITGAFSSRCIRTLPSNKTISWFPGAIVFHLKDFPVSSHDIVLTEIPVIDSLNIKLEHVLTSFEKAVEADENILNKMAGQIVNYCTVFPVMDALFEDFGLRSERESMEAAGKEFTLNVLSWLVGQHVHPVEQPDILARLQIWFTQFAQTHHRWASVITSNRLFDTSKYQTVSDVLPKSRLQAWWKTHGFMYDVVDYNNAEDFNDIKRAGSYSEQR